MRPTTTLTRDRAEFVPVVEVLMEIDAFLSLNRDVDYITFSGAGEPTLHAGIGRIIRHLKQTIPSSRSRC